MQPDLNQESESNQQFNTNSTPPKRVNDFFQPQNVREVTTDPIQEQPYNLDQPDDQEKSSELDPQDSVQNEQEDQNKDLLLDLKDNRDKLRGVEEVPKSIKRKHKLIALIGFILAIAILSLVATFVVKPAMKKDEPVQRQAYSLPTDLSSKPAEEQTALQVIKLARDGNSTDILNTYLGAKDLNSAKQDFASLISSYQSSADGKSVEQIEKKVGKTNLGVVGAEEVNAVSFVYKSNYFEHTNSLYTKLNLYQPTDAPNTWKLYLFEFKAEEGNQPLKADLAV